MPADLAPSILEQLESQLGLGIEHALPCAGGSINKSYQLLLEGGSKLFLKTNSNVPEDFFRCEANGLSALRDCKALTVASFVSVAADHLVLDWIDSANIGRHYNSELASGLSAMHSVSAEQFGFVENNYCGSTPQSNQCVVDGYQFFAEQRLLAQGQMAFDSGRLNSHEVSKLEQLANNLEQRIPRQSAAHLHGDLWAGNVITDADGGPVLVDPACYWGWPETDLAMMQLFGGFDTEVLNLYQEQRPLEPGFSERVPVYNLYHLLNHLNLFGSSYYQQVLQVIKNA